MESPDYVRTSLAAGITLNLVPGRFSFWERRLNLSKQINKMSNFQPNVPGKHSKTLSCIHPRA